MRGAKYRALTAQQIKPEGWLLRQLEIRVLQTGLKCNSKRNRIMQLFLPNIFFPVAAKLC